MRLWSIHPKYLDSKGLVALWREGLLAKKVLEGKTKGYKNHPQLERFKRKPKAYINGYLQVVFDEAVSRGYLFDRKKIGRWVNYLAKGYQIPVTDKQVDYEFRHLQKKLIKRDPDQWEIV